MIGIRSNFWVMHQLDEAVQAWGLYVDAELDKKKKPKDRSARFKQLMTRDLTRRARNEVPVESLRALYPQVFVD